MSKKKSTISKVEQQSRTPTQCPTGFEQYTVVQGDTMFRIAQRFDISLNELISANPHIPNPNVLNIGDVLCVPEEPDDICPPGTERYIVQSGDTMIAIAQRFNVSLEALIGANPQVVNPNLIHPGDVLCIPTIEKPLLPCCIYLATRELDARGSALFEPFVALGRFSVAVLGRELPDPDEFGNYDGYIADILIPDIATYSTRLYRVQNVPTLHAGRLLFSLPDGMIDLPVETRIFVRPFEIATDERGPVVLLGSLQQCLDR